MYNPNQIPQPRQVLGKNMDVVCFIMACEVERQVQENDKLKYRIKEMDDKLLDRNSYEKQIEDLQNRLIQEQLYREEYTYSIETTIEEWKMKCYNQEKQNDELKMQVLQGDNKK